MKKCRWCDAKACDCEDRRRCQDAGTPGHLMCGIQACGCPKFYHPEGEKSLCPLPGNDDEPSNVPS